MATAASAWGPPKWPGAAGVPGYDLRGGRTGGTSSNRRKTATGGLSVEEWARREAEKYIAAQRQAIEEQRRLYLEEQQRQAAIVAERGRALGEFLASQNYGAQIQNIFSNAGQDIAGFAQGFAGNTRSIANAQAQEQLGYLRGSGQEGAIRNEGVGMGDVAYGVGGVIPGMNLVETGAAYAADAAMQPAFAAQIGQLEAARQFAEATGPEAMKTFTDALVELSSSKPELVQTFLEQKWAIQDRKQEEIDRKLERQRQKAEFALKKLESERDWLIQQAEMALDRGDAQLAARKLALAEKKEARIQAAQKGYDVDGNLLPGWRIGADGLPEKKTKGEKTPLQEDIAAVGETRRYAFDFVNDKDGPLWKEIKGKGFNDQGKANPSTYKRIPLARALEILMNKYSGEVKTQKGKNLLKKMLRELLVRAGFKPAGQATKPVTRDEPGSGGVGGH